MYNTILNLHYVGQFTWQDILSSVNYVFVNISMPVLTVLYVLLQ